MALRNNLIQPPALRTHLDADLHRHASWLELLYDLIYVAALAQLASQLGQDYSWTGLGTFLILFIPVWWSWVGQTFYMTRFDSDDLVHRVLSFMQMAAVAAMALFIERGLEAGAIGFAAAYSVVRYILVFEYIRAGRSLPQARALTNACALGFSIAATLWVISIWVPSPYRLILWGLAIVIDIATPLSVRKVAIRFPPNVVHLPERYGLFTIIVLGEAIASTVIGISGSRLGLVPAIIALLSLLLAFCCWWGYFYGVGGAEARGLTPRYQRKFQIWMYSHLPFSIFLTVVAVGAKVLIKKGTDVPLDMLTSLIFTVSLALCMTIMNIIAITSPSLQDDRAVRKHMLPHWILAGLTAAAGLLGPMLGPLGLMIVVAGICVWQVILSLRESNLMMSPVEVESLLDDNEHVPKHKHSMVV